MGNEEIINLISIIVLIIFVIVFFIWQKSRFPKYGIFKLGKLYKLYINSLFIGQSQNSNKEIILKLNSARQIIMNMEKDEIILIQKYIKTEIEIIKIFTTVQGTLLTLLFVIANFYIGDKSDSIVLGLIATMATILIATIAIGYPINYLQHLILFQELIELRINEIKKEVTNNESKEKSQIDSILINNLLENIIMLVQEAKELEKQIDVRRKQNSIYMKNVK